MPKFNNMYCCYDNLNKQHMINAKTDHNTWLRYHSMFWELTSKIPEFIYRAKHPDETFGWMVRHMWEMLKVTKDYADDWLPLLKYIHYLNSIHQHNL
jgi:hypothetical protein